MPEEFETFESSALTPVGKRWKARLIKAGWGAQMYYPADVLERDGAKVFKAGTPIFLDHQTPEEKASKPFGSVQNFAGILATDAVWDSEEQALFAEVEVFEHQQSVVKSLADYVGLSIRATTKFDRGERDGRVGRITSELLKARSVDLVVRAGAGGELMEALESATENQVDEGINMDEVLAAIKQQTESFDAKFEAMDKRITEVAESLAAEPVVEKTAEVEETALSVEDVKALAASGLTEAGIDSVLAKRKAKADQTLADLIESEKAYIQESAVETPSEEEGIVENETHEAEESASDIKLPSAWVVKENK
jgi:hypothetical protein